MARTTAALTVMIALVVLVGTAGIVAGHSWQTTVSQGDLELGVNTNPATPVAGLETEVSASLTDTASDGSAPDRTDWGGVTNKTVEVHINGPNDLHDHVETSIPEDDSHFHFSYQFPEAGQYTLTFETTVDGEDYAFQIQRNVTLMPSEATGEEMAALQDDVDELQSDIDELSNQVDGIDDGDGIGLTPFAIGFGVVVAGIGAVAGLFVGRRD